MFFLNPQTLFFQKVNGYILNKGYNEVERDKENKIWKYKKSESLIDLYLCEDFVGQYIVVVCNNILPKNIMECLSVCPECGSENLQVSILSTWRNDATEQLHEEGRLIYGPVAYDRSGTRPETHICLDCGCQWHNSAAIYQWNKIVSEGRQLTKKDLGLK